MSVVHFIRGYDKATEALGVQYEIPEVLIPKAVEYIELEEDDPDIYGVYPLDAGAALSVAELIGVEMQVRLDLQHKDFFRI